MKKLISLGLALVMVLSLGATAFAAGENSVNANEGEGTVPVLLTVDEEDIVFSVTVPTSLPVALQSDGSCVCADDARITNGSYGAVKVSNVEVTGAGDWVIENFDTCDMSAHLVDSHYVAMKINDGITTADDTYDFDADNFPRMNGKDAAENKNILAVTYSAKVSAQSEARSDIEMLSVIFTLEWDK